MHSGELELWLKEVTIGATSRLAGRALADCRIQEEIGATVLAIAAGGTADLVITPPATHALAAGDVLIVLGTHEQLQRLAELATGAR